MAATTSSRRVERQRARVDRLPPGRLLAQLADVHVAEIGQHQRARDRRRGHHQHVDGFALLREREPLVHAEPVLLVDDRKRQVVEGNVVLKKCMRANEQMNVAAREPFENVAALAAALAAGQDRGLDAGGSRKRCDRRKVLTCQDLGRGHQGGLPAGLNGGGCGHERHHGLARADVALQESQHALGLGEVVDDLGNGAGLRIGQRIGEGFGQLFAQAPVAGGRAARRPAQMGAHERQRKLTGQELVIG